jgi:hypothetical protein
MTEQQQHPSSPPEELRKQWMDDEVRGTYYPDFQHLIDRASRWAWDQREPEIQAAADREREEICHWLRTGPYGASIACHADHMISDLQYARRPKPPSLKQCALNAHNRARCGSSLPGDSDIILHALEALPDG